VYLYTDRYQDDGVFTFDYNNDEIPGCSIIADNTPDKVAASTTSVKRDKPQSAPITSGLTSNNKVDNHKSDTAQVDKSRTCQPKTLGSPCRNARLRANALLYILADHYQIPDMRKAAAKKLAETATVLCSSNLAAMCRLIYDTAPPSALNLRTPFFQALSNHANDW
jgi:hypothetical protein